MSEVANGDIYEGIGEEGGPLAWRSKVITISHPPNTHTHTHNPPPCKLYA